MKNKQLIVLLNAIFVEANLEKGSIFKYQHVRTHMRFKPFKCGMCGKIFKTNGDLKQHRYSHLSKTNFKCNVCKKRFKAKQYQGTHLLFLFSLLLLMYSILWMAKCLWVNKEILRSWKDRKNQHRNYDNSKTIFKIASFKILINKKNPNHTNVNMWKHFLDLSLFGRYLGQFWFLIIFLCPN